MTRSDIGQHPMLVAKPVSDTVQVSLFRWRSLNCDNLYAARRWGSGCMAACGAGAAAGDAGDRIPRRQVA